MRSPAATRGCLIAVDIGGTFTDLLLMTERGEGWVLKLPSTPEDFSVAMIEGSMELLGRAGRPPAQVSSVLHGTTVATNAILEGKVPRTGLLTTRGFRDVLEIGRLRVPRLYDMQWQKPPPLVPRSLRLEVDERMDAAGRPLRVPRRDQVEAAVRTLMAAGVEAIAICLLHAYENPAHERLVKEWVRAAAPDTPVSSSHEVLPEIKEFERTSTTVVNAGLLPTVRGYLAGIVGRLAAQGISAPLQVMQSNGGLVSAGHGQRKPVLLVESGPAAGAVAAAALGRRMGLRNLLAFDMGGTTAKAALIEGGHPGESYELEVGGDLSFSGRILKGGGYLIRSPVVDVAEVGAGGGSIAWVDRGGGLRVGPQSAGAAPGPACYGRGGELPTVTDANVVLGVFNCESLAGGRVKLRPDLARIAVVQHVARALGLSVEAAAEGIVRVANSNMGRALSAVTTERGRDPAHFALVAFGGAGPAHAAALAEMLGVREVIVPPSPGLLSALGLVAAPCVRTYVRSVRLSLASAASLLPRLFAELKAEARAELFPEGIGVHQARFRQTLDLRYPGQGSELSVPIGDGQGEKPGEARVQGAFLRAYRRRYGYALAERPLEVVSARLSVEWPAHGLPRVPRRLHIVEHAPSAKHRMAFLGGRGKRPVPVVGRQDLSGAGRPGPLLVDEYDATTVIPPGWEAAVDRWGNLRLRWKGGGR